ncbi:murein biosynthesis integral membrane protein MurJ [Thermosulfurimonas sp. F29]|uniref:murein biosynthesis integral membrane protein MurJ n=1 Tax=Thermosulfurimonas sp. F29 TaxID=2867247 RepID=UPI001C8297E1|nr:murein biosynthesis integral membrane protein MurJ [Thermosulfurimonas sp. F29]MBX6422404.1 murein biosynthesis integral membrane protein MurJ [Thermosulfurimonas sp. F29]
MADRNGASRIARQARAVTVAVVISRLLGLVREQVLALLLGAGREMDAFVVAYRIPNLLRDLFAEGALGMAFTRVFSATRERRDPSAAFRAASEVLSTFGLLLAGVILLGEVLAPGLVHLLAPAFREVPGKFELTVSLTRIMWPFLFFISLSAILAGMLNALGVFFWPALSSALFNASAVGVGVGLYFLVARLGLPPVTGLALGVLVGGFVQAAFNLPFLRRRGFRFQFRPAPRSPAVSETLRLMAPSVLGLSAMQLNVFLNTYFATSCGEGAVSWLAYAFRLMYVPLGLFGVGLSLALLPEASRRAAREDYEGLRKTFGSSLLVGLSLSLPSATGLVVLAEPIVRLIFEHGRFSPADTRHTAEALRLFALGLPLYGTTKVVVPVFYALGNTLLPALSSLLSVGVNLTVILLSLKHLGFKAVALGTAVALSFQGAFLLFVLNLRIGGLLPLRFWLGFFKIASGTAFMGGLAFILREKVPIWFNIPLCGAFFLGLIRLWGPEEALYFWKFRRPA